MTDEQRAHELAIEYMKEAVISQRSAFNVELNVNSVEEFIEKEQSGNTKFQKSVKLYKKLYEEIKEQL